MNRYQFEDLISEYIENELPLSRRKEFEDYMKHNHDSRELVNSMKNNIKKLNQVPKLKVSHSFNEALLDKLETFKNNPQKIGDKKMVFGFTPKHATLMAGFVMAFIFISFKLVEPNLGSDTVNTKNLVDNQFQKPSSSSILNNDEKKDLVNSMTDSTDNSPKNEKRKNFSNKIQFVND
tara:strand:- start:434 stop:967 length:534 start_codon:yes stop_codon:yes gene_type:complete